MNECEYPIVDLEMQEKELVFKRFQMEDALAIGTSIIERAKKEGTIITVSISLSKHTVFQLATNPMAEETNNWIRRKSNVAYHFGKSSLLICELMNSRGLDLTFYGLTTKDHMARGGSFPIRVENIGMLGTITVSGMYHLNDHQYVVDAIREHLGQNE